MSDTQQSASAKVPYVGSLISLISRSGIRYVGTLYTIDTKASTVALKDVKSFGTEGRHREEGPVDPSAHVYSFIIFRGPDILDLQFLPTPATQTQPPTDAATPAPPEPPGQKELSNPQAVNLPQPLPADKPDASIPSPAPAPAPAPAPVPALLPTPRAWGPPPGQQESMPVAAGAPPVTEKLADSSSQLSDRRSHVNPNQNEQQRRPQPQRQPPVAHGQAHGGGQGRRQGGREGRDRAGGRNGASGRPRRNWRRGPGITIPDEDFDFASMNSKFAKASVETEVQGDAEASAAFPAVEVRYDKAKSFFDDLVSEKAMGSERSNAAQRRATDFETFGETGGFRHRGFHHNRNRGRRMGNRGRNRGGGGSASGRGGFPYGDRPGAARGEERERA